MNYEDALRFKPAREIPELRAALKGVEDERILEAYKAGCAEYIRTLDARAARAITSEAMAGVYTPPEGEEGEWCDLSSPYRMRRTFEAVQEFFIAHANRRAAIGSIYLGFKMVFGNYEAREAWWRKRWKAAAESVKYVGVAKNGRLIAAWFSPIWQALSDFGLPYPPFVIDPEDRPAPDLLPVLWKDLVKCNAILQETALRELKRKL